MQENVFLSLSKFGPNRTCKTFGNWSTDKGFMVKIVNRNFALGREIFHDIECFIITNDVYLNIFIWSQISHLLTIASAFVGTVVFVPGSLLRSTKAGKLGYVSGRDGSQLPPVYPGRHSKHFRNYGAHWPSG